MNKTPSEGILLQIHNLAAPVKEVADPNGFDQGPLCGGQRDIMRKSTLPEKNGTGILCILQFKTVWKIIQCCLTSKGHNGFGPGDLRIFYDENILK